MTVESLTTRDAYVALNLVSGIGPVIVRQLLTSFKTPQAILAAGEQELARTPGVGAKKAEALANWQRNKLEKELALAERAGVRILCIEDDAYPTQLKQIKDAPLVLYIKGSVEALSAASERGLAIVGSRRATSYGEKMTKQFAASATVAEWVVVSGLARGIDTIAHRTCLDHGGTTVAITGGGLMSVYPTENARLADGICEQGCLVSEQPMAMKPDRRTFPMRNRIISGLTLGTLVIEAGMGSGSLITAERAFEQGRHVFALPGRADSPQSRGCNDLIKHGAKLVESLDDVQDASTFLPGFGGDKGLPTSTSDALSRPRSEPTRCARPELSDAEAKIVELLQAGEVGMDELIQRSAIPVGQLLSELSGMELKRVIKQLPGKRFTLYNG